MRPIRSMLAGVVALSLAGPLAAQFGGFAGPAAVQPVPPVNPPVAAPAVAPVDPPPVQPALQPVARPAAQPQAGALTGLPNFAGTATISSTPSAMTQMPSFAQPQSAFSTGAGYSGSPYSPYYSPFSPWNYYGPGATLSGLADLTASYGQFIQDYQKARLLNQQVERAKIESQRKLVEHWVWMSSLTPTPQQMRERDMERSLALARKQAPEGDVLTGTSLNVLLAHLKAVHGRGARGPSVPLDAGTLKQINVSPSLGRSVALIKDGRVRWPSSLQGPEFARRREKFDGALAAAVRRADGQVDAALLDELGEAYRDLETALDAAAAGMTVSRYIDALRFLGALGEGVRALKEPNASKFFNGEYQAKGATVAELVEHMARNGLQFVGAVPGNEGAYRSLYNALVAYDELVSR